MRHGSAFFTITLLASLVILACGKGVDTGTGADDDDAATTPGGDDDDAATPTEVPSQDTTVPATIGGMLGLQRLRANSGTDDFEGGGWFLSQPISTNSPGFIGLTSYYASMPMDTCQNVNPDSQGVDMSGRDAGNPVTVVPVAGSGTLSLSQIAFAGSLFYGGSGPKSVFTPNAEFRIQGTGGADIGPFLTTVRGPGDITVTAPDLWTTLPVMIARDQPLTLAWTSVPDDRPVFVWLTQAETIQAPLVANDKILVCKFADDGQAEIPVEWMGWFRDSGNTWDDKIVVRKYRWWTFNAPSSAPILVTIDSSWEAIVQYH